MEDWTARRCVQECSLAGVQMQVAGGDRSVFFTPGLTTIIFFLLISFVLTGVDETKATANEGLGGVARFLKGMAKYGVGFNRFCLDGET